MSHSHQSSGPAPQERLNRKIAGGAAMNFLGVIAKSLHPLFFVLVTRIYGPATMGIYLLGITIIETALNLTTAGYKDGMIMYTSRHLHREGEHERMYQIMANAFAVVLGLCGLMVVFAFVGGPDLLRIKYEQQPGLVPLVQLLAVSLPFLAIPFLVVASTNAKMIMKYDAFLLGFLKPLMLLVFVLVLYPFDLGLTGLGIAYLTTQVVLSVVAMVVFAKHFSLRRLGRAFLHFRFFWPLNEFSIPQNLNMTFGYVISGVDVLLLGMFDLPSATVAFYATGSQIIRNVRQIKLAFGGAFTPLIGRFHAEGKLKEMEETFAMTSRWTLSLGVPVLLVVLMLKNDLLLLFHSSYTWDSSFMFLLALNPLLSCAFGLAGNLVVMTGHSRWNLVNSFVVAGLNIGLNSLFIPRYGLVGAGLASALAGIGLNILQLAEARWLLEINPRFDLIYKPLLAGAVAALVPLLCFGLHVVPDHLAARILLTLMAVAVYVLVMLALRPAQEDKVLFLFWKKRPC